MTAILERTARENGLVVALAVVGLVMLVSGVVARRLTAGRVQGSAIAILIGLALAYLGGRLAGGDHGLADLALFSGIGLLGGTMLRDFAIVATAFEVHPAEARRAGGIGLVALLLGTILPFGVGVAVARAFGYTDAVTLTTLGAGAITYIVGPVTGSALGARPEIITLSMTTGVIKAILVMVATPAAARLLHLSTPRSAMVFGGLAGTVSGVSAGLAATDRRLVPYGVLVATFHTGIGCLVVPSVFFLAVKALLGP